MTALLEDRVTAFVADHPDRTAADVALALMSSTQSVREILASPFFECSPGTGGRKLYRLAAVPMRTGRAATGATHKARVLRLLQDGRPHSHMEGYRLGVMLHSRVADLRRDGYRIRCWRGEDGNYMYQLGALEEVASRGEGGARAGTQPSPSAEPHSGAASSSGPAGTDGQTPFPYRERVEPLEQLSLTGPAFRRRERAA